MSQPSFTPTPLASMPDLSGALESARRAMFDAAARVLQHHAASMVSRAPRKAETGVAAAAHVTQPVGR